MNSFEILIKPFIRIQRLIKLSTGFRFSLLNMYSKVTQNAEENESNIRYSLPAFRHINTKENIKNNNSNNNINY